MVPFRCVITINCGPSSPKRLRYLANRSTLTSSKAASGSSKMANGTGRTFKMANSSAIAVSAFSPPESRLSCWLRLPGGCAMMSTPLVKTSSGSVSTSFAWPPSKIMANVSVKAADTSLKVLIKRVLTCSSIASMVSLSWSLAFSKSAFWPVKKS